jgi:putative ABC transport system permease protein
MTFLLKLLFKNAFRRKLRTALTLLSIAIAIMAFGLLRTVVSAWYSGVESSSATRLITRNAVSLVFPLPLAYKDRIRQVDGVTRVSYGNWFGGIYIDRKNFFPNFAVEPNSYLDLYPEYVFPPVERQGFLRDRRGAAAGRKLAARFGWKVGDPVPLKGTIFPGDWEFVLRAIYRGRDESVDETQFFFHWDYLNETLKKRSPSLADRVGFYMIEVDQPGHAAAVGQVVDGLFKNSLAETLTETEKAFQLSFVSMSNAIIVAIQAVSFVVIGIIIAVVANTMSMAARERLWEYAVLKTLGFGGRHIAPLIFGESLLISLLGGALGVAATFPAAYVFKENIPMYLPVFQVTDSTIFLDFLACVLVGTLSAVLPAWRAVQVRIAEGLRRIG